jgi:hypothetical protein
VDADVVILFLPKRAPGCLPQRREILRAMVFAPDSCLHGGRCRTLSAIYYRFPTAPTAISRFIDAPSPSPPRYATLRELAAAVAGRGRRGPGKAERAKTRPTFPDSLSPSRPKGAAHPKQVCHLGKISAAVGQARFLSAGSAAQNDIRLYPYSRPAPRCTADV